MCFSANASFGSAILLTAFGIATIRKVSSVSQIPLSFIPFLFAIQQTCEGFLWLSFSNENYVEYRKFYTYIFLFFAHFLWPIFIPFVFVQLEKNPIKRRLIWALFFIGILLAFFYLFSMFKYSVSAKISGHHIQYMLEYPSWILILGSLIYGLTTVLPECISSIKKSWILALLLSLSYTFTYLFYGEYIISIWCYFAAIISIVIFWVIKINNFPLKLKS